jgi:hypothetical protein
MPRPFNPFQSGNATRFKGSIEKQSAKKKRAVNTRPFGREGSIVAQNAKFDHYACDFAGEFEQVAHSKRASYPPYRDRICACDNSRAHIFQFETED